MHPLSRRLFFSRLGMFGAALIAAPAPQPLYVKLDMEKIRQVLLDRLRDRVGPARMEALASRGIVPFAAVSR